MYKSITLSFLLFTFAAISHADDVKSILQKADSFRLPFGAVQVESEVELFKDGQLSKQRKFSVYIKPGRRSLVLFKSAADLGQKVLMLDDRYYLFMPRSKRPIRITPMQRLLGEAATGDIATMTWSEDYHGRIISDHKIVNEIPCLLLELQSTRTGATYARIELYVARDGYWPVQADLYLASGKLAKQATFTLEQREDRRQITSMTLMDRIQTSQRTVIYYRSITERDIPDKFYNPAFLVRNNMDGW